VVGVGNVLRCDDGIGVRVIEGLRRLQALDPHALPRETRLVDGGALLMDLLHAVRAARGLVLVDAVRLGGPEGSLSVQRGDAIVAGGGEHGQAPSSVVDLLAAARLLGWLPEQVALVGIEVDRTELGTELSPVIASALPRAIETARAELHVMDTQVAAREVAVATSRQPRGAQA
jgi:hydrogenase maturation protease